MPDEVPDQAEIQQLVAAHADRREQAAQEYPNAGAVARPDAVVLSDLCAGLEQCRLVTVQGGGQAFHYALWNHPLAINPPPTHRQVADVERWVLPGDMVIDIGAHTGDTSVPMGVAVGPNGLCVAFEPNLAAFRVLAVNSAINAHVANICPSARAIMPDSRTYQFHYSDPQFCNGGYAEGLTAGVGITGHRHPLEVQGIRLDEALGQMLRHKLCRWSYLKVDTEGYDAKILAAHAEMIRQWRPVIVSEVYSGLREHERRFWWETIHDLGYVPLLDEPVKSYPIYGREASLVNGGLRGMMLDEVLGATGVLDAVCLPVE